MKSDLRMLAELGESLDPAATEPPPDLRRRVLTGALSARDAASRPAGLRLAWRLGAVGGAAVVTAGLLAWPSLHTAGSNAPPRAHTVTVPKGEPNAAQILLLAARHSAAEPRPDARPDQFVFVHSLDVRLAIRLRTDGGGAAGAEPYGPVVTKKWSSVDGTRNGIERTRLQSGGPSLDSLVPGCKNGKAPGATDRPNVLVPCTPDPAYDADLPTDPDAMLAYLYRADPKSDAEEHLAPGGSPDQRAFQRITVVLRRGSHSPAVQAAVFAAAARIPGATVLSHAVDVAGRAGVAVTRTDRGVRDELIFNSHTYAYLGMNRTVVARDPAAFWGGPKLRLKPGDVLRREAILGVAIVDGAGQLP